MLKTDVLGERFGRLLIIQRIDSRRWLAECDCGTRKVVWYTNLRSGCTQSCGCLRRETSSLVRRTHGYSKHPLYKAWCGLKSRCLNPNDREWHNYGGRGITVCDRWLNSFENFWADLISGWAKGLTLDRIDNNKGYEPNNCRWTTQATQVANRRNAKLIQTPWGEMTLGRAAKKMGMAYVPFAYRVKHWPQERWFNVPDAMKVRAGRPKRRKRQ